MELPETVWMVEKTGYWRDWKTRIYHHRSNLAQALKWHKDVKVYKGTVVWEEIDAGS